MMAKIKVLVLENFYYRLKQFEDRFKEIGITDITHAMNTQACIEKLVKSRFGVVFLDYDLNNDDGFNLYHSDDNGLTVAEWIKNHPKYVDKNTLIIIHSGNEYGAAKMKDYLLQAHLIPRAWKKEHFDKVRALLEAFGVTHEKIADE